MTIETDKRPFKFKLFDGCFWLCLLLSLSLLFLFIQIKPEPTPAIATIDLLTVIDAFISEQAELGLNEQEQLQQVQDFSQRLEMALAAVAKQHQIILLPREAVLSGTRDLTNELKGRLGVSG